MVKRDGNLSSNKSGNVSLIVNVSKRGAKEMGVRVVVGDAYRCKS